MPDDLATQVVRTCRHTFRHHTSSWQDGACASCIQDMLRQANLTRYRLKDGRPIHDGDCHFWSWSICTCGLLHWLAPTLPTATWYAKERAQHERALYQGTHA
mgnify:CR=1 FL=1